ncbi:FG-GAP repeat protein, partial [Roseibium sp. RKSG952]|uniref:integrin alpha n=1 Tax=Roseibium sp. RKSG952 TaxID=2529384 RepID=UPI0013CCC7FF
LDVYVNDVKVAGLDTVTTDEISAEAGTGAEITGAAEGDYAGLAVAAGDFNGDGHTDLAIGAPGTGDNDGAVYVIYGEEGGIPDVDLSDIADGEGGFMVSPETSSDDAFLGESVTFGDVNGDGLDDLVVGATNQDDGEGAAYVILGTDETLEEVSLDEVAEGNGGYKISFENGNDETYVGVSVATLDMNGDGYDEVAVSNWPDDDDGEVFVVLGSDEVPDSVDLADIAEGDGGFAYTSEGEALGDSIATGDINGDGLEDLVIGAEYANENDTTDDAYVSGAAYIVYGAEDLPDVSAPINIAESVDGESVVEINGATDGRETGFSVATGDVNGDGHDDVLLQSLTGYTVDDVEVSGSAYVVLGSDNLAATVELDDVSDGVGGYEISFEDTSSVVYMETVASSDLNGDGYDDLLITGFSFTDDTYESWESSVYVVFGQEETPASMTFETIEAGVGGFVIEDSGSETILGSEGAVQGGFDLNDDGLEDFIAGAPVPSGYTDTSETYVVYGSTDWEDFA